MTNQDILFEFIAVTFIVFLLSAIIILANLADRNNNRRFHNVIVITLTILNIGIVLLGFLQLAQAYMPETSTFTPPKESRAWGALAGSLITSMLATALLLESVRQRLAVIFGHTPGWIERTTSRAEMQQDVQPVLPSEYGYQTPKPQQGEPLFPQMLNFYTEETSLTAPTPFPAEPSPKRFIRGFNPRSTVHMLALVLVVYVLGTQFITFILGGGLSGVAEGFDEGVNGWSLVINFIPLITLPFLGVGLATRRSWNTVLDRLGIGIPSAEGILASIGMTIGLLVVVMIVAGIWMSVVSEETYEEQTEASDALAGGINTLGLAFLIALTAGVGEEIAFRGALQPIFGFWPTAIIFALVHSQYTLTPAWLIILVVAIGFGWIRERYNTTVAMLTHFTYNFIPLAISVYATEETASFIHWLF